MPHARNVKGDSTLDHIRSNKRGIFRRRELFSGSSPCYGTFPPHSANPARFAGYYFITQGKESDMCGIAGWVDYERNLNERKSIIDAMTETMALRGPMPRVSGSIAMWHLAIAAFR